MGALFGSSPSVPYTPRPYVPPKREAPSGPQLAPGQRAPGATVVDETEEERRRRLLAAQATRDTFLGDVWSGWGGGADGSTGGDAAGGTGPGPGDSGSSASGGTAP